MPWGFYSYILYKSKIKNYVLYKLTTKNIHDLWVKYKYIMIIV